MYEIGFYWVKTATINGVQNGEWQPAFFNGENWELCGEDGDEPETYFDEIGEKIISPQQPERGAF